jgi:hypothetical protein
VPALLKWALGDKSFTADVYPLGLARSLLHLRSLKRFFADADAGTLPSVSVVDPDFGKFSEENPQDIAKGESFAAEVIKGGSWNGGERGYHVPFGRNYFISGRPSGRGLPPVPAADALKNR